MKKVLIYGLTAIIAYECVVVAYNVIGNTVIAIVNGVAKAVEKKENKKAKDVRKKTDDRYIVTYFVD